MNTRTLLLASALVLAPAMAAAQGAPASPPAPAPEATAPAHYGTWGVDLSARDTAIMPGDDFDRYTSGHWADTHQIPNDRPWTGVFLDVYERAQARLRDLVTTAPATSQYGALYRAFMDEQKVESTGDAPLRADIAKLNAVSDKAAFARLMGASHGGFGIALADFDVDTDTANPTLNVLWIGQGGLGLPDRDYYLLDQFKPQRDAYQAYLARTFQMLGHADAAGDAAKVYAFEHAIADKSWAKAERRDIGKINNPMSMAELTAYAPGLDWTAFLAGAGIAPQQRMIVQEKTALRDIAALYGATPLATLKLWEEVHMADGAAAYLTKAWVDSRFAYTKTLSGVDQQLPRWKRGVSLVDGQLGELIGKDYVARYFPPSSKATMQVLVGNLKEAMAARIQANTWMEPATKQAALTKLASLQVMIGYPDKFRDYSALRITPDDLYGDVARAKLFNWQYDLSDLGKPVNKKKWAMNPQTVNAYNGGGENKIVFPAGYLQPPYFDPDADAAVNYGGIGATIGHEISHSFDDQGRKIDATGAVRDWWTAEDARRFDAQSKVFGSEYAKFEAAPGAFVNPQLTMGENIADYAGLLVALDAYHKSLGGKPAPVIDGLSGDQRLFLAFAQSFRSKWRPDYIRQIVTSDPHTPDRFRVLGPLPNIDAWYAAFGVKPGDKMYIPPEQRARIW